MAGWRACVVYVLVQIHCVIRLMRESRKERERGGMGFKYLPFLTAANPLPVDSTHHHCHCSLSLCMFGDCTQTDIQKYLPYRDLVYAKSSSEVTLFSPLLCSLIYVYITTRF
jgi:hypothetical protein